MFTLTAFSSERLSSMCLYAHSHLGGYGFEFAEYRRFSVHNLILHVSLVLSFHHCTAVSPWHFTLLISRHNQTRVLVFQPCTDKKKKIINTRNNVYMKVLIPEEKEQDGKGIGEEVK